MGRDKIHFFATINTEIASVERIDEGKPGGHAVLMLSDSDGPIVLKIGLSFVSVANAAENLKIEIGDKTFEEIHSAGRNLWNGFLSQVQIAGGTPKQQELFYSSLYRSFLWPALRSDHNGEFADVKGTIRNEDFQYYTIPSLWDTYRNKLVLLQLMQPEVTTDVIKSLMDIGELTGFVPTFFHGDHASAFIAGAYARGIRNFDAQKAYKLLLNNAFVESADGRDGRPFLKEYMENGFIPDPDIKNPHVETKAAAGVSKTLEYAYDDYALAQLAKAMKDEEKYGILLKRSQNYKNVFDKKTHFMRGRLENGGWIIAFRSSISILRIHVSRGQCLAGFVLCAARYARIGRFIWQGKSLRKSWIRYLPCLGIPNISLEISQASKGSIVKAINLIMRCHFPIIL